MKKIFLVIFCLTALCIVGCQQGTQEAEASYEYESSTSVLDHEKRKNEYGAGADVIIHEGKDGELLNKLHGEYRFDWNNEDGNHKAYIVGTTKLADIWAKIKGLFNGGE